MQPFITPEQLTHSAADLRIRSLTSLISGLKRQQEGATPGPKNSTRLQIASAIAVLLTRGTEDIKYRKTARHQTARVDFGRSSAAQVIAVTFKRGTVSVALSTEGHALGDSGEFEIRQNAPRESSNANTISIVSNNPQIQKEFNFLTLTTTSSRDLDVRTADHVNDVMQVFRYYASHVSPDNGAHTLRFAIRRCLPKIFSRIQADSHLWTQSPPLQLNNSIQSAPPSKQTGPVVIHTSDVLQTWTPTPNDSIKKWWPRVSSELHDLLTIWEIPRQSGAPDKDCAPDEHRYLWDRTTVVKWLRLIGYLLSTLLSADEGRELFEEGKDDLDVRRLDKYISRLRELAEFTRRDLPDCLASLQGTSFQTHLEAYESTEYKDSNTVLDNNAQLDNPDEDDEGSDLEPEINAKGHVETIVARFQRYLRNVTSVLEAVYTMSHVATSTPHFFTTAWNLNFIPTTRPDGMDKMETYRAVLKSIITRMPGLVQRFAPFIAQGGNKPPKNPVDSAVDQAIELLCNHSKLKAAHFNKSVFTGTIHAEATLMASIANPQSISMQELYIHENNVCPIGVGKKACWACDHLRKALEKVHGQTFAFVLGGTSGQVFPWALPSDFPPESQVPGILVGELEGILVNILEAEAEKIPVSQASSPALSFTNLPRPIFTNQTETWTAHPNPTQ